jgi:hypothetical protein
MLAATSCFFSRRGFGGNPNGFDVSLTSHGTRILTAGIAIASFCRGAACIRTVYFTIDEEEQITLLVRLALGLLRRRDVRVLIGNRRGPHSKYWHFLHQAWDGSSPFILIDDDVIYEGGLADLLVEGSKKWENNVCVRALRLGLKDETIQPYKSWSPCIQAVTAYDVFATNVGGVVIKPQFARKLIDLGEAYKQHCQTADDIWFHWISVRHRMPYTLLVPTFLNPQPIPGTQASALNSTINRSGNDGAIAVQYTEADMRVIKSFSCALFTPIEVLTQ